MKIKAEPILYIKEREIIRKEFYSLINIDDVAVFLRTSKRQLIYYTRIAPFHQRYKTFHIPKKCGGVRNISAPTKTLKRIQNILNYKLNALYDPNSVAHGFIKKFETSKGLLSSPNIITNAKMHVKKRLVFNLDLEDFFPSITSNRVYGLFKNQYHLDTKIAVILTQICCFNNQIPQGAPTSPIITNMICSRLDRKLKLLSGRNFITYSRYADDLTFSTTKKSFPRDFESDVLKTITDEGFNVNKKKRRLQIKETHQSVTGLTVNKKVNIQRKFIRNIRAMLNSWNKKGLSEAAQIFILKSKTRNFSNPEQAFLNCLLGKIEFVGNVRGKEQDNIYRKFKEQFKVLSSREPIKNSLLITHSKKKYSPYDVNILLNDSVT
jgi:RNA-directed DNA polymerase